jgi:ligand-binding SRPBCC domain-containing protein
MTGLLHMPQIERTVEIHAPLERVFTFVTDIRNHRRVAPPQTQEQLLDAGDIPLRLGTVVRLRARYGGIWWTLASRITAFDPPGPLHPDSGYFRDEQVHGPFAQWQHDHWFATKPGGSTLLTDRFTYSAPLGLLGRIAQRLWLNAQMRDLLEYMQAAEKHLLETEPYDPDVLSAPSSVT